MRRAQGAGRRKYRFAKGYAAPFALRPLHWTSSARARRKKSHDILPKIILVFTVLLFLIVGSGSSRAEEVVVLLHGIANIPLSMKYLENSLEKAGYQVYNLGYPSTDVSIEAAAAGIREKVDALGEGHRINFVGHSMGNLVIRMMLGKDLPGLGRVVMIAPPNQGSFMAERLEHLGIYRWIFGPAGQELPTDNKVFFEGLPVPKCEFGIIAGGRGTEGGYNPLLEGDDDGTVRVQETKLPGAADFTLVHNTHTLILFDSETVEQTIEFLKTGRFKKLQPEVSSRKSE